MQARENVLFSTEVQDIIIADAALTIAFALALSGGLSGLSSGIGLFVYLLPISFVAVSLSFVLHELMHKFVAQHFGAIAAFRKSDNGIIITLATSLLGFLIGLPGATMIYTSHFTREEEGYVSLAGPLTNFTVFAVFFVIGSLLFHGFMQNVVTVLYPASLVSLPYLQNVLNFTIFISLYLAFFNMLPIYPLDGSKVLRWNKYIYFAVIAVVFALLAIIIPAATIISGLVFVLIVAILISSFYKHIMF